MCGRIRFNGHLQNPLAGRDDDFTHFIVNATTANGDCLHEDIRHVRSNHRDLNDGALALQLQYLRSGADAILRADEQQHGAVGLIGIDLQSRDISRLVFLTISNQLDVVEAIAAPVVALTANEEH
jgi:hypothetical protein